MINFFEISSMDKSVVYLYRIFGSMHGVISPNTTDVSEVANINLLSTMFRTFNSTILAVGAFIVVYVTIVGVMATAYEGEFMGKKWNNIWIPIRTVLGISALVPTASGYSGIQIIMMWVIIQGIGAADVLWGTVLGYVSTTGSAFASVSTPSSQAKNGITDLFAGLVCAKSADQTYPNPYLGLAGSYFCSINKTDSYCSSAKQNYQPSLQNTTQYKMGPGLITGACGTLEFCDVSKCGGAASTSTLACSVCRAQVDALKDIIPILAGVAEKLVQVDYQYQNYFFHSKEIVGIDNTTGIPIIRKISAVPRPTWIENYCTAKSITNCTPSIVGGNLPNAFYGGGSSNTPIPNTPTSDVINAYWDYGMKPVVGEGDFIAASTKYYVGKLSEATQQYMQQLGSNQGSSGLDEELQTAQQTGWILAGGYYYAIAGMNKDKMSQEMPAIRINLSSELRPSTGGPLVTYRNNYTAAGQLIKASQGQIVSGGGSSSVGQSDVGNASSDIADVYTSSLSAEGNTNPLAQLAAAGYGILFAVQILFAAFMITIVILGIASKINVLVLGSGLTDNPLSNAVTFLYMFIVPLIYLFMGLMVTVGASLGIYVPLIPYVVFTMGAVGWFMSTVEAMVAGPLVALGILSPSGHHELMGKAEPAIMLLFNIFLRPSLMIFGLIASMFLAMVSVALINAGFGTAITGMAATAGGGKTGGAVALAANPLALVFILCAYVSLIIAVLNKCFSMIHVLPERVTVWISGHGGAAGGEQEALHAVKGAVDSGAAGAKGYGGQAQGVGKGRAEAAATEKKKQDAA
ncbi:MAG: Defect in organelle trafficking protein, partial [uncultured bacterium]